MDCEITWKTYKCYIGVKQTVEISAVQKLVHIFIVGPCYVQGLYKV